MAEESALLSAIYFGRLHQYGGCSLDGPTALLAGQYLSPASDGPELAFPNEEDPMIRFFALVAVAFAFAVIVGESVAQAQSAADRRTQPGSGQCRLSNGQPC